MRVKIHEEESSNYYEAFPLLSLNHISLLCRSVSASVRFYEDVLGFVLIKRPSSFNFNGAWLYNYGIGIHLIQNPLLDGFKPITEPHLIDTKDNHISFQCTDVGVVKRRLQEIGCNCENIPIVPLSSSSFFRPRMVSFMENDNVMMETASFLYAFNQLAILGCLTLMVLCSAILAVPRD